MTLSALLSDLAGHDPKSGLLFETDEGPIGAGYHVTELRQSLSTGIDCAGRVDSWAEARIQLLDGSGNAPMRVGKFIRIAQVAIGRFPDLADLPLLVEFGHGNKSLRLMSPGHPVSDGRKSVVPLTDVTATCKPVHHRSNATQVDPACCQPLKSTLRCYA